MASISTTGGTIQTSSGVLMNRSMRLFGVPYQFSDSVDPRVSNTSGTLSKNVGRAFNRNILCDAPMVTIIPGKPKYIDDMGDITTLSAAMINNASGDFSSLKELISSTTGDKVRYYDFQRSYVEYMKYVNILCRACASYLEISEKIDGDPFQSYDWRNYRSDATKYETILGNSARSFATEITTAKDGKMNLLGKAVNGITTTVSNIYSSVFKMETTSSTEEEIDTDAYENILQSYNFVQFYVDPNMSTNESMDNSTSSSKIKDAIGSAGDMAKELNFITQSAGTDLGVNLENFADSAMDAFTQNVGIMNANNDVSRALNRIISLGSNVIKGENVIMPDIYQSSDYSKSYGFTVHLKSPYGSKFGIYMDIIVPLMHLLALGLPRQTTANTYGSPFLVKTYVPGVYTCNMGIVKSISVNRVGSNFSIDGLPTEVDVEVSLGDLYSDLTMTPQNEPALFINNSSLQEYLATTCGLSLIEPQLGTKLTSMINIVKNSITDIPTNAFSMATEAIDNFIADHTAIN